MNVPKSSELDTPNKLGRLYIEKRYKEFYLYLLSKYDGKVSTDKLSEKLYLYYNNLESAPLCPICGGRVPFLGFFDKGYQTYCSLKCSNNSPEVISKKESTCLEKYGVPHACQNDDIKGKLIDTYVKNNGGMGNASVDVKNKHTQTMIERYGVSSALKSDVFVEKGKDTRANNSGSVSESYKKSHKKTQKIHLQKYGVEEILSSPHIQDKIRETNLLRYGGNPIQNDVVKSKMIRTKQKNRIELCEDLLYITNEGDWVMKCPHSNCNKCENRTYITKPSIRYDRMRDKTELCTNLLPIQKSHSSNTTIELFVQNILDECGISYITSNRTILGGQELDIYIPSHNLAIECDGIYWHATNNPHIHKPIKYHSNKYIKCREQGIQLITLWQDWIYNKPDIVRSIILNKLGLISNTIYARNCTVCEVNSSEYKKFLDENHIQGCTKTQIKLGLYHLDELVGIMSFIKRRGNIWELDRFCNKLNMRIVGGASKLLIHFIQTTQPSTIISFSSNDISNGNLYKKLGFDVVGESTPYWYVSKDCTVRKHRDYGRKDAIISRGVAPSTNKDEWIESKVMFDLGYLQIYDSGMTKWELRIEKTS